MTGDYRRSHLAGDCAADFDAHYRAGRGRLYWRHFERPYLEQLFARLGRERPGPYLDFACGTGRILEIASPHFPRAIGIDVSPVMLAEARRRAPHATLLECDVMTDPPEVGSFRVVSLFRFILSAEDELRRGVLRWLRQVIAPDGVLVVNNHLNRHSLVGLAHWLEHIAQRHPQGSPTDRRMEAMLSRHGFTIVERFGFGVIPPWRHRLWVPSRAILSVERLLGRSRTLQRFAKDQIYVCRPSDVAGE